MKRILIFLMLFLSGCAAVHKKEFVEKANGTKKIAVLSVMKEELQLKKVGITVFNNKFDSLSVKKWNVNQHVEKIITSYIRGKFVVPDIPREELVGAIVVEENYYSTGVGLKLSDPLKQLVSKYALDGVLVCFDVFRPDDPFFNTNQRINGFGIYERSMGGKIDYVQMITAVFDPVDGKHILMSGNLGSDGNGIGGYSTKKNHSSGEFHSLEDLEAVKGQELKESIFSLFDELVVRSLKFFGFKIDSPVT